MRWNHEYSHSSLIRVVKFYTFTCFIPFADFDFKFVIFVICFVIKIYHQSKTLGNSRQYL
ncbi:hypothetical protein GCM10008014_50720 [Paenibacillus silvae]|uniref:Uncharacterized protein n=1 Tax=Paenibacillus silvae TaxID=1325358 RepID=A0ABQ1ZIU3_9BACL|nr:hypothetical protein GCM10008014_50720 [Paenibacillus silvae]